MFFLQLWFFVFFCWQSMQWTVVKDINKRADFICIDHLDHLYIVENRTLTKYSPEGNYLSSYSSLLSGTITEADVSDPLKILLFYGEFNQIQWLDNQLSELGSPVLLEDLGFSMVQLACQSKNNGFWIYDQQQQQIVFISGNLSIVHRSGNLSTLIANEPKPNKMIEENNRVYLNIPEAGILVFNNFGVYIKTIPVYHLESFQVKGEEIIYHEKNQIKKYHTQLLSQDSITFPANKQVINMLAGQKYSFAHHPENIRVWQLQ